MLLGAYEQYAAIRLASDKPRHYHLVKPWECIVMEVNHG